MPSAVRDRVDRAAGDAGREAAWVDAALAGRLNSRQPPSAHRALGLLLIGLLVTAALVLWLRLLAGGPHWPLVWQVADGGALELGHGSDATLQPLVGRRLQALLLPDGQSLQASAALLPRAPRWTVDDAQRQQWQAAQQQVSEATRQPSVTVRLEGAADLVLAPRPRGMAGLGVTCWLMAASALALTLAGAAVLLTAPGPAAALYALLAGSHAVILLLIGAESLPGMGLPAGLVRFGLAGRLVADATAAAALVHVFTLYPRRRAATRRLAAVAWTLMLGGTAALLWQAPAGLWWYAQGLVMAGGATAAWLLGAQRLPADPLARQLQRLVLAGTGALLLLSAAVATAEHGRAAQSGLASAGAVAWSVFFAALLMLGPFLLTARQVLREFTVLAGISAVAVSLCLLLPGVLPLPATASLLLALGASVAIYVAARPWILAHLAGSGLLSGERMFDSLYRAARALEQAPDKADELLARLLQEVFDPKETARSTRTVSGIRVAADGSTLVVPVMSLGQGDSLSGEPASGAIVLRHAGRGRRLFTQEDGQLCERLIEQLRRAVAFDRAVEQGRTEERTRIAQDLHDDIGARLLTLMYKSSDPEIEEYIRHTLQDLKTLTRGLAASNHRLSHAAAEWKADITQRLNATGCELQWSFSADRDLTLSVVQWSGLTRVLRELVNNIISHAGATQVEIGIQLERGQLQLQVSDDGIGRAPDQWSHGLGLGGVRKRVKLLGGQVRWIEREPRGIRCEVRAPLRAESAAAPSAAAATRPRGDDR